MNRRTFVTHALAGTTGLVIGGARARAAGEVNLPDPPPIHVHGLKDYRRSPLGMPGLFPGRVIEIHDPNAIRDNHVSQPVVRRMIEQGMKELTGETSPAAAWARFVTPNDVVGIKINPAGAPACCSSPEIVREVIHGLRSAGVRDILVYDRFSYYIQAGGYHALLPVGIRVVGVEHRESDVSGYDTNIYCQADFFGEWETRSYLASVVTQQITKIVNIPTLKDHSAAGVTGCLKNLGYGSFNNVNRTHKAPITFTDPLIGVLCSTEPLRSKAVLSILDGMREVWHGGPQTQLQQFIGQPGLLLFGTDPVAVDTIELAIISKKRELEGALSLWDRNPANMAKDGQEYSLNPRKNLFFRQPAHIEAAGRLGLGVWEINKINYSKVEMG
jgi:uncharacterized protein (DUF362 family)